MGACRPGPFHHCSVPEPTDQRQPLQQFCSMGIARRLYIRVFKVDDSPAGLIGQIYDYHRRIGIFASAAWPINDLKDSLKDKVRDFQERFIPSH
jgi:hypothetical protein